MAKVRQIIWRFTQVSQRAGYCCREAVCIIKLNGGLVKYQSPRIRYRQWLARGVSITLTFGVLAACSNASGSSSASNTSQSSVVAVSQGEPAPSEASGLITDPNQVCADEVLGSMDAQVGDSFQALVSAIGLRSPIFQISSGMVSQYNSTKGQDGQNAASVEAQTIAAAKCTTNGNPVLASGQLQALIGLVGAGDAAALEKISYFGSAATSAAAEPGAPADPSQANGACTIELRAALDFLASGGSPNTSITSLRDAIGMSSPLESLAQTQLGTFLEQEAANGASSALAGVVALASPQCSQAGNPVLNSGQLEGLVALTSSEDAALLNSITYFG